MADQPYPPIQARELMNPPPGYSRQAWQDMSQAKRERIILKSREDAKKVGATGDRVESGVKDPKGAPASPSGRPEEESIFIEEASNLLDAPKDFLFKTPPKGAPKAGAQVGKDAPLPPNQRRKQRQ